MPYWGFRRQRVIAQKKSGQTIHDERWAAAEGEWFLESDKTVT